MFGGFSCVLDAVFRREIAEHRLNRFLHVHVTLCAAAGLLPLFTPDAADRSAAAWVLPASWNAYDASHDDTDERRHLAHLRDTLQHLRAGAAVRRAPDGGADHR